MVGVVGGRLRITFRRSLYLIANMAAIRRYVIIWSFYLFFIQTQLQARAQIVFLLNCILSISYFLYPISFEN